MLHTRSRRGLLLLLGVFLFCDFVVVGLMRAPRPIGTFDPPGYPISGAPGQFQLVDPDAGNRVGHAMFIVRRHNGRCLWAPTQNVLDVRVEVFPYDNSAPTAADRVRIGNQWADKRGDTGPIATLFRAGGGQTVETRPWGHVHNALAALAAIAFFTGVALSFRDRLIAARAERRRSLGLCSACGYPRNAERCPECGQQTS